MKLKLFSLTFLGTVVTILLSLSTHLGQGASVRSLDHCASTKSCVECVTTRVIPDLSETCVWEITRTGTVCVSQFLPSEGIISTAFDIDNCESSSGSVDKKYSSGEEPASYEENSISTDEVPDKCLKATNCEECVTTWVATKSKGDVSTCVWELTRNGERCVQTFLPAEGIITVAMDSKSCKSFGNTTSKGGSTRSSTTQQPFPLQVTAIPPKRIYPEVPTIIAALKRMDRILKHQQRLIQQIEDRYPGEISGLPAYSF